jgi:FkbM family methyltransferase
MPTLPITLLPAVQRCLRSLPRGAHRLIPVVEGLFALDGVVSARLGRGPTMRVRSRDVMHRQIFWLGEYERETTAAFLALLRPGMTVLDVGANVGYFTLLAARAVGPEGRVVAFEPVNENHELLCENVRLNGLENVTVERVALADRDATGRMFLYRKDVNSGMGSLMGLEANAAVEQRAVATCTLDAYLAGARIDRVDVIKMDIQGGEGKALDGMRETLARDAGPTLIWELNPLVLAEYGDSASRLVRLLEACGYRSRLLASRRLVPVRADRADDLPDGGMLVSSRGPVAVPKGWRVDAP